MNFKEVAQIEVQEIEKRPVSEIESEIYNMDREVKSAMHNIKTELGRLNCFEGANELSTKEFIKSFDINIKEIKEDSKIIIEYKNLLSELYDALDVGDSKISDEESAHNKIASNNKYLNIKNRDEENIDLKIIATNIKTAIKDINGALQNLESNLRYIYKEDNNKNFIEDMITKLEPIGASINKLCLCEEMIDKLCKNK